MAVNGPAKRWVGVILAAALVGATVFGPAPAAEPPLPPLPPESSMPLPPLPAVAPRVTGSTVAATNAAGTAIPLSVPRPRQDAAAPPPPVAVMPALESAPADAPAARGTVAPPPLRRPIERPPADVPVPDEPPLPGVPFRTPMDPPIGFTGYSSVTPSDGQSDPHFLPIEDRWRLGFPEWDRYDKGHPVNDDYPYIPGRVLDPFNQNKLKGDYPIIGQHIFLEVTASLLSFQEFRQIPTATTPFESTRRVNENQFFQRPNQYFTLNNFSLSIDLFHGDAGFKQPDWRLKLTPIFNLNNLSVQELGIVSPNVLQGTTRTRTWWALQEVFYEQKLGDTSSEYDTMSIRLGNQPFNQDFRGFLFADINDGIRLFGTRNGNRDQYNLAYFRQWEKDTNSQLNTFNDRRQNLVFANYYRQDFIFPGYTAQLSFTFNNDPARLKFDKNRFLVRPDPVGTARPHEIDVAYLGWAGDGHIGRINVSHQFYWALGHDSFNNLANQGQSINAQMAAFEASYDRDWVRFRASFFYSSGDKNINNSHATGFDSILDQPNFAGGPFSYWNRQQIPLFGVNLVQRLSLVPDLRSSKIQGQSNFVNPGIWIPTLGMDMDLTPKLKMINNVNVLWFDHTNVLEQFLFDGRISKFIGTDVSCGFEYKPLLSENVMFVAGASVLIPGQGFRDIYNNFNSRVESLFGGFATMLFLY
jgi:hypothetical protein